MIMMSAGCCGTKKQKLTCNGMSSKCSSSPDDYATKSNSSCNGFATSCDDKNCQSMNGGGGCTLNGCRFGLLMTAKCDGQKPMKFASIDMVVFCFDVLHSYLHNYDAPKNPTFPNDQFPLFVTWKMGKEKKLRGCIGTFTSTSLHQGLREYAITSACKDSRFDPITADDFSRLHCSISLLLDFEVADHYLDWQIGVHGIRIEFSNEKGSKKAATYLPEVSIEQGWDHIQTIDSLLRKGGYRGTITPDVRTSVCLVRFQSEKIAVSYAEYLQYKKSGVLPNIYQANSMSICNGCSSTGSSSTTPSSSSSANDSGGDSQFTNQNSSSQSSTRNGYHFFGRRNQNQQQSNVKTLRNLNPIPLEKHSDMIGFGHHHHASAATLAAARNQRSVSPPPAFGLSTGSAAVPNQNHHYFNRGSSNSLLTNGRTSPRHGSNAGTTVVHHYGHYAGNSRYTPPSNHPYRPPFLP